MGHYRSSLVGFSSLAVLVGVWAGCAPLTVPEGGSNGNDQSQGGTQGATLLTGAMTVSPYGDYALMQRNTTSVLVDLNGKVATALSQQVERFVFAKDNAVGFALLKDRSVAGIQLSTGKATWAFTPAYKSADGALLANLSDDGSSLLIGDIDRLIVVDTQRGDLRDVVPLGEAPTYVAAVPGTRHVLVAGTTRWVNHKPQTNIFDVDLVTLKVNTTVAANCQSSIQVLPDATRAFMSPTFCEEGASATPQAQWTNPDPVSVIDLDASGPKFLKNLPGFGPVAMDREGKRLVAYLDMKRIDASMFDNPAQIPSQAGDRYHLMVIDPKSLGFSLTPIGATLPRFAMAPNGQGLLVDSTVAIARGEVDFKVVVTPTGATASLTMFGGSDAGTTGYFDIATQKYHPFSGAIASLDRFVQLADSSAVYTLKTSADGLGGDLFKLDIAEQSSTSLGQNLRDIGLLRDGKTLLLRIRRPAAYTYDAAAQSISYFRQESYCLSLDGVTCGAQVDWKDQTSFITYQGCASLAAAQAGDCSCKETHDCY